MSISLKRNLLLEVDDTPPFPSFNVGVVYCVQGCKSEGPRRIQEAQVPADWPTSGTITFRGYEMRYRESAPIVLKGLDFVIQAGEKLGIVGRTGSGKTLTDSWSLDS